MCGEKLVAKTDKKEIRELKPPKFIVIHDIKKT